MTRASLVFFISAFAALACSGSAFEEEPHASSSAGQTHAGGKGSGAAPGGSGGAYLSGPVVVSASGGAAEETSRRAADSGGGATGYPVGGATAVGGSGGSGGGTVEPGSGGATASGGTNSGGGAFAGGASSGGASGVGGATGVGGAGGVISAGGSGGTAIVPPAPFVVSVQTKFDVAEILVRYNYVGRIKWSVSRATPFDDIKIEVRYWLSETSDWVTPLEGQSKIASEPSDARYGIETGNYNNCKFLVFRTAGGVVMLTSASYESEFAINSPTTLLDGTLSWNNQRLGDPYVENNAVTVLYDGKVIYGRIPAYCGTQW